MAEEKESMEDVKEGKAPKKSMFNWVLLTGIVLFLGIGGYLGGLAPVFAFQLAEVRELAQSTADTVALQQWQKLHSKKQTEGLNAADQMEFCILSRQLGFQGLGCA